MLCGLSEKVGAEPHFGLVHPLCETDAYTAKPFMSEAAVFSRCHVSVDNESSLLGLGLYLVADGFR